MFGHIASALQDVEIDDNGEEDMEDELYDVLQARIVNYGFGKSACSYCSRKGHGWRLMDILTKNGMRDSRTAGKPTSGTPMQGKPPQGKFTRLPS